DRREKSDQRGRVAARERGELERQLARLEAETDQLSATPLACRRQYLATGRARLRRESPEQVDGGVRRRRPAPRHAAADARDPGRPDRWARAANAEARRAIRRSPSRP